MPTTEEGLLLDGIVDGLGRILANPTTIGEIVHISDEDITTAWVKVGGQIREATVLRPNEELREGNRVYVKKDETGSGKWEVVGFVVGIGSDIGAVFPESNEDSSFPPVVRGPTPGADPGAPPAAGTVWLDRRPDNNYGGGGTVIDPPTRTAPARPPGTGTGGVVPPLRGIVIPYSGTVTAVGVPGDETPGTQKTAAHGDHLHEHADLPVADWPAGREPHEGYSPTSHTHTGLPTSTAGATFREMIPIPANTSTKDFTTTYEYAPSSLLVFLNGVAQAFYDATGDYEVAEDADRRQFHFHTDVVVDGDGSIDGTVDRLEVYYARYAGTDPAPPSGLVGWGVGPWGEEGWGL